MVLRIPLGSKISTSKGLSPTLADFPTSFDFVIRVPHRGPYPVDIATYGFASSAFARHYSRNLGWFLFLRVLRCFSSPGSLRNAMDSRYVLRFFAVGVSPFGNLRIEAYLQLPAAYRSLSRPSSAPDAKAFTLCSYSLELSIKSFDLCCSLELLEFHKQIFIGIHIAVKGLSFCLHWIVFHLSVKL